MASGQQEEDEIVFFVDEMKIKLCPRMFPEWSLKGYRHHVEATCSDEGTRTLFGGVDIATGNLETLIFEKGRTWEFIQFVDMLLTKYPDKKYAWYWITT